MESQKCALTFAPEPMCSQRPYQFVHVNTVALCHTPTASHPCRRRCRTPAGCVRRSATWTCCRPPSTRPRSCTSSGTGRGPAETPAAVLGATRCVPHHTHQVALWVKCTRHSGALRGSLFKHQTESSLSDGENTWIFEARDFTAKILRIVNSMAGS